AKRETGEKPVFGPLANARRPKSRFPPVSHVHGGEKPVFERPRWGGGSGRCGETGPIDPPPPALPRWSGGGSPLDRAYRFADREKRPGSGEDAALVVGGLERLEGERVRGDAGREVLLAREAHHAVVGADHAPLELRVDLLEVPGLAALVLDPLEVADRHAAGVRPHVRDHFDAALREDGFALRVDRAVRALGDEAGPRRRRLLRPDPVLGGSRNDDVGLEREELLARDLVAGAVAGDRAVVPDVIGELVRVEALGVVQVAGVIADRDGRDPELVQEQRRVRADVAEALDGAGPA